MSEFFTEFGTYLIKYGVFMILAVLGFMAGTKWRKAKDAKTSKMTEETMEENKQ
jgi:hypothetical protein